MKRPTTSASNIHRRRACPGSENLERGLPDEGGVEAETGTLLHGYFESPSLDPAPLKSINQDLLRIGRETEAFVFEKVHRQFGIEPTDTFEEGYEKELVALPDTDAETPGHVDHYRYYPRVKVLVIIDQKTGFREVTPAEANYQLRVYAIGGAKEWNAEHVVVAISQPRLAFELRVTMAIYGREDIEASEKQLAEIRAACRAPDAPLVASESSCRYCRAKLICDAYKEKFTQLDPGIERSLSECTDQQLDRVLVAIQFADHIRDQARDIARARVKAGQLTNWKVGKESEMRDITNMNRAMVLLMLRGDVKKSDVYDCMSLSFGALEEKVRKAKGCTWKRAKEIVADTLEMVTEKKTKKASLTRVE